MIGTNLPPGTKIVCVNDNGTQFQKPNVTYILSLDGLTKGQVYTIQEYELVQKGAHKGEILVILAEISRPSNKYYQGFHRARFRRLHLPESLLECLNVKELELTE